MQSDTKPSGKENLLRKLVYLLPAIAFLSGMAPEVGAQQTSLSASECANFVLVVERIVKMRRGGLPRDQLKAILTSSTPDKEKALSINRVVDTVYDESPANLDAVPIRYKAACVAPPPLAKTVLPATVDASLKRLRLVEDKMTGTRWYLHPSSPKAPNSNGLYLYFGRDEGNTFTPMHLVSRYYGSEWLFVKDAWAKADGQRIAIPQDSAVSALKWQRDNGGGAIWEEFDSLVTKADDINAVRKLADSRDVTIRFEGSRYIGDRTLTPQQIKAVREMIAAYEAVTGKTWK